MAIKFLALSTELSSSDIRQMAVAYGKRSSARGLPEVGYSK